MHGSFIIYVQIFMIACKLKVAKSTQTLFKNLDNRGYEYNIEYFMRFKNNMIYPGVYCV